MLKDVDSLGKQSHRNLFLLLHFHYPLSILSFSFSSRHFCVSLFFSHLTFFYPLPTAHSLFLYPHHASLNKLSLLLFSHIPHSFSLVPLSLFPCNTLSLLLHSLSLFLSLAPLSLSISLPTLILSCPIFTLSCPTLTLSFAPLSPSSLSVSSYSHTLSCPLHSLSRPTLTLWSHSLFLSLAPLSLLFPQSHSLRCLTRPTLCLSLHSPFSLSLHFFYRSTLSPVSLFIFISPTLPSHSTRTVGLLVIGKSLRDGETDISERVLY